MSIVVIMVCFAIIAFTAVLYGLTDYNYFGEFKCMFKWATFELNFFYIHIGIRLLFGLLLGALSGSFYSGIVVAVGLLAVALLTIIKQPYAGILHSVRSAVNLLIGAVIFTLYSAVAAVGPTDGRTFYSRVPLMITALLFVVVLMAGAFVARQYAIEIKKRKELDEPESPATIDQEQAKHQEFMNQKIE